MKCKKLNSNSPFDTFTIELIKQLQQRRYTLNLSQLALDDRIGCAAGLVAKWECGNRKPTAFNLYCWAKALDCKLTLEVEQ